MLYLDYSRKEGEWLPNQYGGRENLDAVAFLQEMNATVYKRVPGVVTIAEESTAWPGVSRPTHLGGLGFGFKWNMGWMHDSLDWWLLDTPDHRGVALLVKEMNEIYKATPALYSQDVDQAGFAWIDANDASGNVFSFLRYGTDGPAKLAMHASADPSVP